MRFPRRLGAKTGYLLWLTPSVIVGWILFLASVTAGLSIGVAGLGILVLPVVLTAVRFWTDLQRRMAGSVLGEEIPRRRRELDGGPLRRFGQILGDRTTWRDLGWLVVNAVVGTPLAAVSLILVLGPFVTVFSMFFWWIRPAEDPLHLQLGTAVTDWGTALGLGSVNLVLAVAAAVLLVPPIAGAHARLSRLLLGRSAVERLEKRVDVLTRSRSGAVDAHGAELRRIERDLHDGTQARLVAIAMRLGIARGALGDDPALVERLLADAHEGTEAAMTELRAMIRGMYPPILADQGLPGALDALAADLAVPAAVELGELGRLPAPVETAAYYVLSESLANVTRHSEGGAATVRLSREGDVLAVSVADDGVGGAAESLGSGLTGIRRRVEALDGSFTLESPPGAGTRIEVRLPCGS